MFQRDKLAFLKARADRVATLKAEAFQKSHQPKDDHAQTMEPAPQPVQSGDGRLIGGFSDALFRGRLGSAARDLA